MIVNDHLLLRLDTEDDHNIEDTLNDIRRSSAFTKSIVVGVSARIDDMLQVWPDDVHYLSDKTRHFLPRVYYDAIHATRNFPKRQLGDSAAKHFHDALLVGLAVGVSDLETQLTILWHDYIEDGITAERKRRINRNLSPLSEQDLLLKFSRSQYNIIRNGLCAEGMDRTEAHNLALRVTHNVHEYMTRRDEQFYYRYIGHLFRPVGIAKQKRRAIVIAKYCDRYANDRNLQNERPVDSSLSISYEDIASIFSNPDAYGRVHLPEREALNKLRARFNRLSYAPFPSSMLAPDKWISCTYKSAVLDTIYRLWTDKKPERSIPEVERIPLATLDQRQMYDLFTYVVNLMGPSIAELCFIDDVVLLHRAVIEYELSGGFHRVTEPAKTQLTDYDYDGFISTFLDTKVRGEEDNIKSLVENPFLLAKATIALYHWRHNYVRDRTHYITGLTGNGITLAPPVVDSPLEIS
ncbi:MAG: hypothetical protein AABX82_09725 [Nanoarchaeota archaeon]